MTIDLNTLWDFSDPKLSEQRFNAVLETAGDDDTLILQTQIARTYGLRSNFARAQEILDEIEPDIQSASPEVRVRHALELGRTLSSAAHSPDSQTDAVKDKARATYNRAYELALASELDALAIDALHMLAFVDTAPEDQLKWGQKALSISENSNQPAAQKWEASLRNNIGYALHQLEKYEEALEEFRLALSLRKQADNDEATRIARWMIAWTLRSLERLDDALKIQLRLEKEYENIDKPDSYVFQELEELYRALGDTESADKYLQKREALG